VGTVKGVADQAAGAPQRRKKNLLLPPKGEKVGMRARLFALNLRPLPRAAGEGV